MSGGADALATWDELRALRGVTETLRIADLVDGDPRRFAEFGAVRADYRRGEVAYAFIDLRGEVLDRFRAPARP